MREAPPGGQSKAIGALAQLFAEPPSNHSELRSRLRGVSRRVGRRWLIDHLTAGSFTLANVSLFAATFGVLGVDDAWTDLLEIALQTHRSAACRAAAVAALATQAPDEFGRRIANLPQPDLKALTEASLLHLLLGVDVEEERSEILAETLLSAPPEGSPQLVAEVDRLRGELGLTALTTFSAAARALQASPLLDALLDALVRDASPAVARFLQSQRDQVSDTATRKAFQRALMQVLTRITAGEAPPQAAGSAHLSPCDGTGAYLLVGAFKKPGNGYTVSQLRIRLDGDITDAVVIPFAESAELRALLERTSRELGCGLAPLPLAQAGHFTAAALTAMEERGRALPSELQPALALFEHAWSGEPPPGVRAASHAAAIDPVRALFSGQYWSSSWFFPPSVLRGAPVAWPVDQADDVWFRGAAAHVYTTPWAGRALAMTRHMAVWLRLSGQRKEARLLAAAARDMEARSADSAVLRLMLERTLANRQSASDAPEEPELPSPDQLRRVREQHFAAVEHPRGKDLASLHFTEAARTALSRAQPAQRLASSQPMDLAQAGAHTDALAVEVGKRFAGWATDAARHTRSPGRGLRTSVRRHLGFSESETEVLASRLLDSLLSYFDEVCSVCPLQCLKTPGRREDLAFFSDIHPLLGQKQPTSSPAR